MIEVRVPGHPPGGNDLHRMHPWQVRKSREEWRGATLRVAREVMPEGMVPLDRASLAVAWEYRVRRVRDLDNLVAGLKPMIDALVEAGILAGDHSGILHSLGPLTVQSGCPEDVTILRVLEG